MAMICISVGKECTGCGICFDNYYATEHICGSCGEYICKDEVYYTARGVYETSHKSRVFCASCVEEEVA